MIQTDNVKENRVCQGDILKDIEYIEYAVEENGFFVISKIIFPFAIVLTQDCDLEQDFKNRTLDQTDNQDKYLISSILAPLYNIEHVYKGEHLSELSLKMQEINRNKTPGEYLKKNQLQRYHYLEFDNNIPIPASIIDFKHYFTVNIKFLLEVKKDSFICKISPLYRENISMRFANFLARIGLPG